MKLKTVKDAQGRNIMLDQRSVVIINDVAYALLYHHDETRGREDGPPIGQYALVKRNPVNNLLVRHQNRTAPIVTLIAHFDENGYCEHNGMQIEKVLLYRNSYEALNAVQKAFNTGASPQTFFIRKPEREISWVKAIHLMSEGITVKLVHYYGTDHEAVYYMKKNYVGEFMLFDPVRGVNIEGYIDADDILEAKWFDIR